MRRVLFFAFGFVFAGLTAASFLVPSSQSSETRFLPMLGNDVVLHMMAIASAAQPGADPDSGARVNAAISFEDARRVVDLAAASASAAWCGVDWQRGNLQKLLTAERKNTRRSPEAVAYVARLHQVAMEMFERDLRATASCPERHKREVAQFLAAHWRTSVAVALDTRSGANGQPRP